MSLVLLFARVLLCVVFLVAGLAKLADLAGSRQAMRDFGVPDKLADIIGLHTGAGTEVLSTSNAQRPTSNSQLKACSATPFNQLSTVFTLDTTGNIDAI